jgi:hypothetical protein
MEGPPYACERHGGGGTVLMVVRPLSRQTAEQRWCGMWYDCPLCQSSVLEMSPELIAHIKNLKAQAAGPRQGGVSR